MSNKIKDLAARITQARHDYYNDQPKMSDAAFDALVDELTGLDPDHPAVTAVGAPIVQSEWKKVKHEQAMTSLNKINTSDEFINWAKECSSDEFLVCDKIDGLSISTDWKEGKLIQAATRGDSDTGENITVNVIRMKGIPKKLKSFTGNIRGEIVLLKSDHKAYFPNYSNPRNAASGIAKRLDGEGANHLTVMMYTIASGKDFDTEKSQFEFLDNLGLITPKYKLCKNTKEVIELYNKYESSIREGLDYEIDGLVLRVNDISKQISLGEKNHRPRGQTAMKFAAPIKESILRKIEWQTSNTGRINPVAIIDPVSIGGVTVERASLHNFSLIQELKLFKNCRVLVSRRNDVVPYIEENLDV